MELIVIDTDRMKIMLSREELLSYNVDAKTLDPDNEKTKRILYDIVDRARRSAGLECGVEGMFVRVFPSSDGGCEMYVTKYSQLYDEESGGAFGMEDKKRLPAARKKRPVYRFSCVPELLSACRALMLRGYNEVSDAYITEDGEDIYLVLSDGGADISVVLEYAEPVFFGGMMMYLSEHTRTLAEKDAVGILGALC